MAAEMYLPDPIRERLRSALIRESDLLETLRHQEHEEIGDRPGHRLCRCTLPVPRRLDPETAELVSLAVYLRPSAQGAWEVYEVGGLDPE